MQLVIVVNADTEAIWQSSGCTET